MNIKLLDIQIFYEYYCVGEMIYEKVIILAKTIKG